VQSLTCWMISCISCADMQQMMAACMLAAAIAAVLALLCLCLSSRHQRPRCCHEVGGGRAVRAVVEHFRRLETSHGESAAFPKQLPRPCLSPVAQRGVHRWCCSHCYHVLRVATTATTLFLVLCVRVQSLSTGQQLEQLTSLVCGFRLESAKECCRRLGVPMSGRKAEVIRRLTDYLRVRRARELSLLSCRRLLKCDAVVAVVRGGTLIIAVAASPG
jgi:hypothetical protein